MAHAIFNVSPVKFLSSIQDHVFTVTPTFRNKIFTKSDKKGRQHGHEEQNRNSSSCSPVTLQLTLPTDTTDSQMTEVQHNTPYQMPLQQPLSPSARPIDIPRSAPLNVPMHSHINRDYEALAMSNNFLSTSYHSQNSYSHQQEHNLISLANSISRSPYLPAEDLTVCFDGLAVKSPTGSFYSNGGVYSPQQINSPINIGSPHRGFGSPSSPVYFGGGCSPQSPSYLNNDAYLAGSPSYHNNNNHQSFVGSPQFNPFVGNHNINQTNSFVGSPNFPQTSSFVGSPNVPQTNSFVGSPDFNANNSFVGSPNSPTQFLGSPALSPVYNNSSELGIDTSPYVTQGQQDSYSNSYGFTYLSPSLHPQYPSHTSPLNSPSPTGSYANNLYLFPPSLTGNHSRPSSPVPDDVILTASEVNNYINSPYSPVAATPSPTAIVQQQEVDDLSEFLFSHTSGTTPTMDDLQLFPNTVPRSSPHTQPQSETVFSEQEEEEEDDIVLSGHDKKRVHTTTPSGRRAKVHKCPYCNHTSNRANNMREHTQIHNPNRPKPHSCKLCNRAFARKHDMNRHYISCKKQRSKTGTGGYVMTSPPLKPS